MATMSASQTLPPAAEEKVGEGENDRKTSAVETVKVPAPSVHVLYDGYSCIENGNMRANCSCVLIKGKPNVIVDTMTAWDKDKIIKGLSSHGLAPSDIQYLVGTHGHSDHVGNLNLFTEARHIVGFTIYENDEFFLHPFETGERYSISDAITVVPTPGHMAEHVSILVASVNHGMVAIAGDLFEKEEDIANPRLWQDAGSEQPHAQKTHRSCVADLADHIVPGHGPMFTVTEEHRALLKEQLESVS
uniref:Metallo-beta-lactamase domain-containing protein 1 n=1 Tax=Hirondellea gigas TaxID=1518452 RepID=A0A2P2I6F7_9CRUS